MQWPIRRLGELARITHGFAFSGMSADLPPPSPVVIGIGNFDYSGGFRFATTPVKRLAERYPKRYELAAGDVVLAMTCQTPDGAILGIPGQVPDDGTVYLHNQRLGKAEITDPEQLDLGFFFQLARWSAFNRHLVVTASGSKILHTSPGRIEDFEFAVPPIREQRSIAATLGALDDKIESNWRAIDVAERLGDALFAASATSACVISDVATLTMGSSPPGSSYNEEGVGLPFYQGVRDFGQRFPRHRVWTAKAVRVANPNETLLSVRAPVGKLNRAFETCCIGRGVASVRCASQSTIYYALRAASGLWEPFQQEGTVFGAINRIDLAAAKLPWPTEIALPLVETRLGAIDTRIASLTHENDSLTALRDTLLPELLSGRIRVPEARDAVEEAAA